MLHPHPFQLQSYLDDELAESTRESIRSHLERCPSCRATLQAWQQVSLALKRTLPSEEVFLPEGSFWLRLATELPARRPSAWPLVPYLPPLLLAIAGTLVQVLITATFVAYDLTGLRVIPSLAPAVSDGLSSLLSHGWLRAWVGGPGEDVAQDTVVCWDSLSWPVRRVLLLLGEVLVRVNSPRSEEGSVESWSMSGSSSAR